MVEDLGQRLLGGSGTDLWLRSGTQPLRQGCTHLNAALRGVLQTKESRWYRFFSSDDTYDPDRLTFDQELLRRFYLARGYADFQVVSAIAERVVAAERLSFEDGVALNPAPISQATISTGPRITPVVAMITMPE